MTEWKDLGEVSRGQQSISFIHEGHERHEEKILRKMVIDENRYRVKLRIGA